MSTSCPRERFPSLDAAEAALLDRRARAVLAGSPQPEPRAAYPCQVCGGAHITRRQHAVSAGGAA